MKILINTSKYTDIILNRINTLQDRFPLTYSENMVVSLNGIDVLIDDKTNIFYYMLNLIDNKGYKYYKNYSTFSSGMKANQNMRRFFHGNKYTYDNINMFIIENNLNLKLLTTDLSELGAIDFLKFSDDKGCFYDIMWNSIQTNTERFKFGYEAVKLNRKEERTISKEYAIKTIYDMQLKLDRPIVSSDFMHPTKDTIGIKTVRRIWKDLWLMQKDLGLTITGRHAKKVNDDDYIECIKQICNDVYKNENRKTLMTIDFKKYGVANYTAYFKRCNENGTTLRNVLNSYGFELQKSGNGLNHVFDDGEKTVSKCEFEFSSFLRDNDLKYNKDYFRDVRYDKLSTEYKGNMNCDYEIHFQGRIFYVELAGILGNKEHEEAYKNNIQLKSKSKEKYRLGLNEKRKIFESNKLEHYIILPSEMNINMYSYLLNI